MRFNLTITVRLQAAVGDLLLRQAADTEDGARSKGQGARLRLRLRLRGREGFSVVSYLSKLFDSSVFGLRSSVFRAQRQTLLLRRLGDSVGKAAQRQET